MSWHISFALGELVATQEESGAMTGINRLQVVLTRQDLNAQWQCRVNSPALHSPLVANLRIDVHGKNALILSFLLKMLKGSSGNSIA
jgi:hypothetical protein